MKSPPKAQYDALGETIKAHKQTEPAQPEEPKKLRTLFGYIMPWSDDRYVREYEQYEADSTACEDWKTALGEYVKKRDEQGSLVDDAAAILRNPKSKSNADRIEVGGQARRGVQSRAGEARSRHRQRQGLAQISQAKGYHEIGDLREAEQILITEGYATAASVCEATGRAVVVALDSWNLLPVAKDLHETSPAKHITTLGDDDRHLPDREPPLQNVGREKALEAAREVEGNPIFPIFLLSERGAEFTGNRRGPWVWNRRLEGRVDLSKIDHFIT